MHNFLLSRFHASNTFRRKTQLCCLQQNAFFIFSSFSSKAKLEKEDPFTVSYLINSCGLSPQVAIKASKRICLKNPDTADSVLRLLKNSGFSESQVSQIVKRLPSLLSADPDETLLPKLKFLQSMGLSSTDLPEVLVSNPQILKRSLSQWLIPRCGILRSVLSNDDEVTQALKCAVWDWADSGVGDDVVKNIKLLRELGVPQHLISFMVTGFPDVVFKKHTEFAEAVNSAKEMGFDLEKSWFVLAAQVLAKLKKSEWESRLEVFESWGWSRDVALSAFKKFPNCMLISEKKIRKVMNFLVNEMGFSALDIAEFPVVLSYSLEKRIIPRCMLVQTLKSKGLVKNDLSLAYVLNLSKNKFLDLYVTRFRDPGNAQMCPSNVIQP